MHTRTKTPIEKTTKLYSWETQYPRCTNNGERKEERDKYGLLTHNRSRGRREERGKCIISLECAAVEKLNRESLQLACDERRSAPAKCVQLLLSSSVHSCNHLCGYSRVQPTISQWHSDMSPHHWRSQYLVSGGGVVPGISAPTPCLRL